MKANELMVGDLVRVSKDVCIKKGTIVRVRAIDGNNSFPEKELIGCASCEQIDDRSVSGGVWCEYLEPIPLTPEILEKNGIIRKSAEDADAFRFLKDDISIVECFANIEGRYRCIISYGETRLRKTICFVHELQHALRLCGIDKEITM